MSHFVTVDERGNVVSIVSAPDKAPPVMKPSNSAHSVHKVELPRDFMPKHGSVDEGKIVEGLKNLRFHGGKLVAKAD